MRVIADDRLLLTQDWDVAEMSFASVSPSPRASFSRAWTHYVPPH